MRQLNDRLTVRDGADILRWIMIKISSQCCIAALRFVALLAVSTGLFCALAVAADNYPQRSIRLIIPYPPGGAGDIVGRMLGLRLGERIGQQFVIDNRGGGGQVIATEMTAKAAPDGYTLLLASATHGVNPGLRDKLPYDSIRDFSPITLVASSPLVFVANPSLGVGNIRELVAAAKAKPGAISYGSSGPGTGGHLAVELLNWLAGIKLVHIPYKGAGPALIDLVAGQVQVVCTSPLPAMPHVRAGRLRALAMTGTTRSRAAPEIPTVAEAGYGAYQASLWYALLGPVKMPAPIVKRLHADAVAVIKSQDMTDQLMAQGAEPVGNNPQELELFMRSEIERWTKVIKQAQIRAD
jgi:tripartite-type tricarboxylate transporter receptor subunit TctC